MITSKHKTGKKVLSVFLSVLMLLGCFGSGMSVFAADEGFIEAGVCGPDLRWTYYNNGTLEITGFGKMTEFQNSPPWSNYKTSITNVILPEGLENISSRAFSSTNISNIVIPSTVKYLGTNSFAHTNLENIYITEQYEHIEDNVFWDCSNVKNIYLSKNITSEIVQKLGFYNSCPDSVIIDAENPYIEIVGTNCIREKGSNTLLKGFGNSIIPDDCGITIIGSSAFSNCQSLTEIVIPDTVTTIKDNAFSHTNLTSVNLPNSLIEIGYGAFNTTGLETIVIPDSVTSIGGYAFGDTPLREVELSKNLKYLSDDLFSNTHLTDIVIPEGVTIINNGVFRNCEFLTNVTLPDTLHVINQGAFDMCTSLTELTIPKNVTSIASGFVSGCSSLVNINISEENEDYKFVNGCLVNIPSKTIIQGFDNSEIPTGDSVKNIGAYAFAKCTFDDFKGIPKNIESIDGYAFSDCKGIKNLVLPESLSSLGYFSFSGIKDLSTVVWSKNLTTIPDGLFYHCTNLTKVEGTENVTIIGDYAFQSCYRLTSFDFNSSVNIHDYAFAYTGIKSFTLTNDTKISGGSFLGSELNTLIFAPDIEIEEIPSYAFNSTKIKTVTIPKSVKTIGRRAFASCYQLETIKFENGSLLETIGDEAFDSAYNLNTPLNIPNYESVNIGYHAFDKCGYNNGFFGITNVFGDYLSDFYTVYDEFEGGSNENGSWNYNIVYCNDCNENIATGWVYHSNQLGDIVVNEIGSCSHSNAEYIVTEEEYTAYACITGATKISFYCPSCSTEIGYSIINKTENHIPNEPVIDNAVYDIDNYVFSFNYVTGCIYCGKELNRETVFLERHPATDENREYFTDENDKMFIFSYGTYVPTTDISPVCEHIDTYSVNKHIYNPQNYEFKMVQRVYCTKCDEFLYDDISIDLSRVQEYQNPTMWQYGVREFFRYDEQLYVWNEDTSRYETWSPEIVVFTNSNYMGINTYNLTNGQPIISYDTSDLQNIVFENGYDNNFYISTSTECSEKIILHTENKDIELTINVINPVNFELNDITLVNIGDTVDYNSMVGNDLVKKIVISNNGYDDEYLTNNHDGTLVLTKENNTWKTRDVSKLIFLLDEKDNCIGGAWSYIHIAPKEEININIPSTIYVPLGSELDVSQYFSDYKDKYKELDLQMYSNEHFSINGNTVTADNEMEYSWTSDSLTICLYDENGEQLGTYYTNLKVAPKIDSFALGGNNHYYVTPDTMVRVPVTIDASRPDVELVVINKDDINFDYYYDSFSDHTINFEIYESNDEGEYTFDIYPAGREDLKVPITITVLPNVNKYCVCDIENAPFQYVLKGAEGDNIFYAVDASDNKIVVSDEFITASSYSVGIADTYETFEQAKNFSGVYIANLETISVDDLIALGFSNDIGLTGNVLFHPEGVVIGVTAEGYLVVLPKYYFNDDYFYEDNYAPFVIYNDITKDDVSVLGTFAYYEANGPYYTFVDNAGIPITFTECPFEEIKNNYSLGSIEEGLNTKLSFDYINLLSKYEENKDYYNDDIKEFLYDRFNLIADNCEFFDTIDYSNVFVACYENQIMYDTCMVYYNNHLYLLDDAGRINSDKCDDGDGEFVIFSTSDHIVNINVNEVLNKQLYDIASDSDFENAEITTSVDGIVDIVNNDGKLTIIGLNAGKVDVLINKECVVPTENYDGFDKTKVTSIIHIVVNGIVSDNDIIVSVGDTDTIDIKDYNGDALTGATYESSDDTVAAVDADGNVTGVGFGTAVITVKVDDLEKEINVVVVNPEVVLDNELTEGDTDTVEVTGIPAENIEKIEYLTSDDTVVTVDEDGNITAVGAGNADITIKVTVKVGDAEKVVEKSVSVTVAPAHIHTIDAATHENDICDTVNDIYSFENNTYCTDCNELISSIVVELVKTARKEADVNNAGNNEYYTDKNDASKNYVWNAETETYEPATNVVIPKIETFPVDKKPATVNAAGENAHFEDNDGNKYVIDEDGNGSDLRPATDTDLIIPQLVPTFVAVVPAMPDATGVKEHYEVEIDGTVHYYEKNADNSYTEKEYSDFIIPIVNVTEIAKVPATHDNDGTKEYYLGDDGNKYIKNADDSYTLVTDDAELVIPAIGHIGGTPVRENEVAPTCTEKGSYDEVVYCTECGGEVSRTHKTIPATGHTDADNDIYCDVCGEIIPGEGGTLVIHDGDHMRYRISTDGVNFKAYGNDVFNCPDGIVYIRVTNDDCKVLVNGNEPVKNTNGDYVVPVNGAMIVTVVRNAVPDVKQTLTLFDMLRQFFQMIINFFKNLGK